jgi:hypothetical protein
MADQPTTKKKPARLQHVVAHIHSRIGGEPQFDEVVVFGQKIDALEYCHGKTDWVYAAVPHGASFTVALKAAQA